jgi:stress-induced morphogen
MRLQSGLDKELTAEPKGASAVLSRSERMALTLTECFSPQTLIIEDDSARHRGHAGAAPGGETHFILMIVSAHFEGLSRVARSRAVMQALAGEFDTGLHALSLKTRTPAEAAAPDV